MEYVKDVPGYTYTTVETIALDIDPNADLSSDEIYETNHDVLNWDQTKMNSFVSTWCTVEGDDGGNSYLYNAEPLYLEKSDGTLTPISIERYGGEWENDGSL